MSGFGVFALPHLSADAVAAFADGVLSGNAATRARKHCAECSECAAAVRAQREAAFILRTAPTPSLPSGLLDRLAGLPMSTSLPPPAGGLPIVIGPDGAPVIAAGPLATDEPEQPRTCQSASLAPAVVTAGRAHPRRRKTLLPIGLAASAAAVVAAGALGGQLSSSSAATNQPVSVVKIAGHNASGADDAGDNAGQSDGGQRRAESTPRPVVAIGDQSSPTRSDRSSPTLPTLEDFPLDEQLTPTLPLAGVNRHAGRP